ncbi:hypothetical protein N752_09915 [Desulforamulus aquiferis]|nr:GspE/PulE family protein [Desulforamulus aquiferis]RYD05350.1 hypothetical protein N752_09915 [Desulforamulus aquiferis]
MAEANDFSLNEEIQRILGPSVANEAALPYHSGVERVPEEAGIGDAPVVRVLNTIINQAIRDRASDIHIEPMKGQLRIRFRIDGLLHEKTFLSPSVLPPLVTRIKILASLDIAEKRLPQDGRFHAKSDKGEVDLRISTCPQYLVKRWLSESLAKVRSFANGAPWLQPGKSNEAIGDNSLFLRHDLNYRPTGSGKTTTLYALINQLNNSERNIVSIEEPVEYVMPGVNQTQVNNKTGLSFAAGLRSILRQDPNIIIVGEIRDLETANIAAKAGNSGHLVLSTLHTNDAPGAIARLVDMGVEPYVVASSVVGVVCQRLVRVLCPGCKEPYQLETRGMERDFSGIPKGQDVILYRPRGCPACRHIATRGVPVSKKFCRFQIQSGK